MITLPYYLRRMVKRGGYANDFHHRFGMVEHLPAKSKEKTRIWIQAVSVGEVRAIQPMINELCRNKSNEIILTVTTSTAYTLAKEMYGEKILKVAVFPIDFYAFSNLTWQKYDPDLAILVEGELWPEHIHQANKRKVPVILINARLSDNSFKKYRKVKFLAKHLILDHLDLILTATPQDHERYLALGADSKKTHRTGNIKFDVTPKKILTDEEKLALKKEMGFISKDSKKLNDKGSLILLGSSTWDKEEEMLLNTYKKALDKQVDCRLLLVPRHSERKFEIAEIMKKQPFTWHLRSIEKQAQTNCQVYIADTTGELSILSQVADVAFIGKSIPPNEGGQTPIEAAALGIPIVYGPNMSNFNYICKSLESSKAAIHCQAPEQVEASLIFLLQNPEMRKQLGSAASKWVKDNQGATEKTIAYINQLISERAQ